MTIEDRIARKERNLESLVAVQDQMMDLRGMTMEGERRLATRMETTEGIVQEMAKRHNALVETVHEIDEKLNGLIAVVDGVVRGPR